MVNISILRRECLIWKNKKFVCVKIFLKKSWILKMKTKTQQKTWNNLYVKLRWFLLIYIWSVCMQRAHCLSTYILFSFSFIAWNLFLSFLFFTPFNKFLHFPFSHVFVSLSSFVFLFFLSRSFCCCWCWYQVLCLLSKNLEILLVNQHYWEKCLLPYP